MWDSGSGGWTLSVFFNPNVPIHDMDPISVATTCMAVLKGVTEGVGYINDFVVSCRSARSDLAAVSRELSELETTLHILKADTSSGPIKLPRILHQRICGVLEDCNNVVGELKQLIKKYDAPGLDRAAAWAISGKKDAEKIRESLEAHKGALGLVVEATTL